MRKTKGWYGMTIKLTQAEFYELVAAELRRRGNIKDDEWVKEIEELYTQTAVTLRIGQDGGN
jgi:hypothetical protein